MHPLRFFHGELEKYCGRGLNISLIQSFYKGSWVTAVVCRGLETRRTSQSHFFHTFSSHSVWYINECSIHCDSEIHYCSYCMWGTQEPEIMRDWELWKDYLRRVLTTSSNMRKVLNILKLEFSFLFIFSFSLKTVKRTPMKRWQDTSNPFEGSRERLTSWSKLVQRK